MPHSRLLAVPVSILLAASLAACGGGSTAADESSSPTTAEKSAPSATPTPTVEAFDAENVIARLAASQAEVTSYDVVMSMTGAAAMDMTGSLDLADGKQNVAMSMSEPELGTVEMRFVDGLMFLRLGELTNGLFLQIDPNDSSNPLAASFAGFDDLLVSTGYEGTEDAVVSVTPVGAPETLNGVEVQAYDVVLDTAKFTAEAASGFMEEGVGALPPTLTYTYWVDENDFPHKTTYEVAGASTTISITNVNKGTPVTAPAADQVTTEMPF